MLVELILFIVAISLFKILSGQRSGHDMPPGPRPYPIFGNLIQIFRKAKDPFIAIHKFSEDYGDVFTLRFGSKDFVVLTSYEAMRETLGKSEWSGRIWNPELQARYLNQHIGMIFLDGEAWKEQRRFTVRHLRDFGFGKQESMENVIHEELTELVGGIGKEMGDKDQILLNMHTFFNLSVLNVLWSLMAGVRYAHDDQTLLDMISKTDVIMKTTKVADPADVFPILRKLLPRVFGQEKLVGAYNNLHDFFREFLRQHKASKSYGNSEHFIDVYLQKLDDQEVQADPSYSEDQLIALCTDFFIAGSETTSNTLEFAILYLILNPKVQERVYKEIIAVVGSDKKVSLEHESKMPYTEATIMEVQRAASIAPLAPPHRTTTEVSYRGYKIPQDTIVMLNLYSINHNKEHWGDPEVFRPERFLDTAGCLKKDDHLIPFGIGKRACLGESLAKMSLFLYFTTLIKNFKFETIAGEQEPTTEPVAGLTLSPTPYHVVVRNR